MSLKYFHIVFMTIASIMTIANGYLFYIEWRSYNETKYLVLTILAVIFCVALILYNNYFLKKMSTLDD
ncbi:MAG: hypothetical protein CMF80_02625 [Candidatus Marinimicrobia bacterium]|jgi:drug/metabolite transporter superfamily protein YnfA|nr:hypothetical protein [Candidatus Neomarinimicrobiota bacterium]